MKTGGSVENTQGHTLVQWTAKNTKNSHKLILLILIDPPRGGEFLHCLPHLAFTVVFDVAKPWVCASFFLHFSQSLVPVFIPLFIHLQITSTFVFLHNSYINISEKTLMLRTEK